MSQRIARKNRKRRRAAKKAALLLPVHHPMNRPPKWEKGVYRGRARR